MKTRLMMLVAIMFTAVFAVACSSSGQTAATGQGGGNGDASAEQQSPADSMIQMYKDGQIKASPHVPIHDLVFVGQIWTVETDFGAGKQTETWQITTTVGRGVVLVEHITAQGFILVYEVNAWAEEGEANVQKAWIGKKGEKAHEIKVAEFKAGEASEDDAPGIILRSNFRNVEMGGKTWNGEATEIRDAGQVTKTWVADNGWFNGIIRMDLNGKTAMKLTEARTNARLASSLKWE
jgi:hypothetical protein